MKKKVLIIGPIPPPAGGVSIHITRLAHILKSGYSIELIDESRIQKEGVLNIRKFNPGRYLKTISGSDIVHIHSGTRSLKYAHILFSRLLGKKTILTIHSYKKKASPLLSLLDGWIYSLPHLTIIVTNDFNSRLKLSNTVVVKDAFLPPILETEAALPAPMATWISDRKAQGYQVAVGNAWRLDTHNGQDLYGLDLCIEAAKRFRDAGRKICFVFVVCDLGGHLDIAGYEKLIDANNLRDVFYLQKSQISFINLVRESDIVLRPTNTDGDALTVREALYLNKTVIASDVVKRPEGTRLFANRNTDSLVQAIEQAVTGRSNGVSKDSDNSQPDFANYYKEIYSNLN